MDVLESRQNGRLIGCGNAADSRVLMSAKGPGGIVTLTGGSHSLAGSDPSSGHHARALPSVERCGPQHFAHGSFEEMTLVIESVVGRGSGC